MVAAFDVTLLPDTSVTTQRTRLPLFFSLSVVTYSAVVAELLRQFTPSSESCHCQVSPVPLASILKLTRSPNAPLQLTGCFVMASKPSIRMAAALDVSVAPLPSVTTQRTFLPLFFSLRVATYSAFVVELLRHVVPSSESCH